MKWQGFKARFLISLLSNIVRGGVSFAISLVIAKAMGPTHFGKLSFLLGTFLALRQLLDLGTSSAFFTFLSKYPRSFRFISFYFGWLVLQFIVCILFILVLFPNTWISVIWQGENRYLVILAFVATFLQGHIWPIVTQAFDAYRKTIWIQLFHTSVVALHLIVILGLYYAEKLNIYSVLIFMIIEYGIATCIACWRLKREWSHTAIQAEDHLSTVIRLFWIYCFPLIPYAVVSFCYDFFDRWLLQMFGGKEQQAYFQISQLIASVSLLATVSILRILWKEIANARHEQNDALVFFLYEKTSKCLYFAGAVFAGFLLPWAKEILVLLLGVTYIPGSTAFAIMLLYPIHQSLGQLIGTMMMASEHTKLYSYIGITSMAAGIGMTWLFLAPSSAIVPGLNLGALGIALKYVLLQLIQVNIGIFILSKINKWKWEWAFQIWGLAIPLGLGYISWGVSQFLSLYTTYSLIWNLIISGLIYSSSILIIVWKWPDLFGLDSLRGAREGVIHADSLPFK